MTTTVKPHPLRNQLAAEIHARPVPAITGSVTVLYLAMMQERDARDRSRSHLSLIHI